MCYYAHYIIILIIYVFLKSMILKLVNSVEEQNVENEDVDVDDIDPGMWI